MIFYFYRKLVHASTSSGVAQYVRWPPKTDRLNAISPSVLLSVRNAGLMPSSDNTDEHLIAPRGILMESAVHFVSACLLKQI